DGISLKPSTKSDIVYIELINPKGTVEKKITVIAKNGKAAGDFSIDKEALGGMYKIKAYTNWMKNESNDNAFVKDLQVQEVILPNLKMKLDFEKKAFGAGDEVIAKLELNTNENKPLSNTKIKCVANLAGDKLVDLTETTDEEGIKYIKFTLPKELKTNDGLLNVMIDYNGSTESISRSIPIILNKIQFALFPEGGDLLTNADNTVAFKALNEFNKPADVEGFVLTEKGSKVASFSSFHQGMGSFKINPQAGENYIVNITKPEGIKETFKLPEANDRGYSMHIDNSQPNEVEVSVNTTETEDLALIAQVRGKIYYNTVFKVKPGNNKIVFPTTDFPIGVSQITLFDSKGIARAERLAFVNKDKQMNISIETEKEKYLPREKVKMTISVKDERGLPMPANLSMAVVNDQLLSFADDKSGNILSQLLLQQDINEKIEEPAFYFNKKEPKADKALDHLLMTAGWRRFTWEKIIDEEMPLIKFPAEKAIVSGVIYNSETGKPMSDVTIKSPDGSEIKTDETGKFKFTKLDLTEQVTLNFNADGYYPQAQYVQNYNQNMVVYMYKVYKNQYYGHSRSKSMKSIEAMEDAIPMSAAGVGIRAENNVPMKKAIPVAKPVDRLEGKKDIAKPAQEKSVAKNKEEKKVKSNRDDAKVVAGLADKRANHFAMEEEMDIDANLNQVQGVVYYRARQFAAPKYDKQENVENRTDFRNTIYWNPNVEIGHTGKKTIEFYTSDDITSFRTTIEGLSADGSIGRVEKNFFTQLPFAMSTKIPVEVATEDFVSIPLTLKNNTDGPLGGVISITSPDGLQEVVKVPSVQTIMPGKAKTIYLDYKVLDKIGYGEFTIGFKACGLGDAFTQTIRIVPKGFPVQNSFSAQEVEKEYEFEINKMVNGSLKATFNAYPNVVNDLMKGVE
ncbi:MAG: alpha-2-macroglobulin family protein, partial [Sphingobacteriaceae bacterium]